MSCAAIGQDDLVWFTNIGTPSLLPSPFLSHMPVSGHYGWEMDGLDKQETHSKRDKAREI